LRGARSEGRANGDALRQVGLGQFLDVLDAGHQQRLDDHRGQSEDASSVEAAVGLGVRKGTLDPDLLSTQIRSGLRNGQEFLGSFAILLAT
jgi:hypothetical protein